MKVKWVGGPWDGITEQMPAHVKFVVVAVKVGDDWQETVLPVQRTPEGVLVQWHEPSST